MTRSRFLLAVMALLAAGAASAQRSPAPVPVVMYATSWCPHCARARAYFARMGIAYVEHDVEKSVAASVDFKRLGGRGVPLILVGREKMSGFDEQEFAILHARVGRAP